MPAGSFVHLHVIMGTDLHERLVQRCIRDQEPLSVFVENAVREKLDKQPAIDKREQGAHPGQPKLEYKEN